MTNDQAIELIESALKQGFLNQAQADTLKEELFMFPGGNILSLMIRRGMITRDQANDLENPSPASNDVDNDLKVEEAAPKPRIASFEEKPLINPTPPRPTFIKPRQPAPTPAAPLHPRNPEPRPAMQPATATPPPRRSMSDALGIARQALHAAPAARKSKMATAIDPYLLKLLQTGRERNCSDLHLTANIPPYLRQEGRLYFLDEPILTAEAAQRLNCSVLTPEQKSEFEQAMQIDFSFEAPGVGRFRANVFRQKCGVEGEFRFIPEEVPTLESLEFPAVLETLTSYPQGLNLVAGPTGCGKTTTIAAMLEFINCHRHEHIITVEDPVEYVFQPAHCQITQREVGTHTASFATALRTALRQDPDIIMIGELRDLETTSIAITAAETGHLVFATLHTSSAIRTVARILDVYPPSQRPQICMMVAESLRGIISQQLVPRKDGNGRVCAMEILLVTTGVSQVIKEGKTHQLVSHMQSGRKMGMVSMDDALMELYKSDVISGVDAWSRAENKDAFEMIRTQS